MKPLHFLALCLVINLPTYAQQKTSILVISNQEGKLLVDGTEQAWLKSSEPTKLSLGDGDHIIQLKTTSETFTKTITCADGKQKVLNFDSPLLNVFSSATVAADLLTVTDIQVDLPGTLSGVHIVQKVYSFDEGDQISFDFDLINKNGTVNIALCSYPDNGIIYSRDKICTVTEEKIKVPKRGIYYFAFSTNHIVNRHAHFLVKRKAATDAGRNFTTSVRIKYDTSYQEILSQQTRVYSTGNIGHPNRTVVRINLPAQTTYWVYWIGVGQESMEKMKQFAIQLSTVASKLSSNPLYSYGLGLIPSLPVFNSTATVDYRFTDNINSEFFLSGNPNCKYYTFKEGTNVTTDYAIEKTTVKEVNLCLWNNNRLLGHDVNIRVGAFIVKASYIQEP